MLGTLLIPLLWPGDKREERVQRKSLTMISLQPRMFQPDERSRDSAMPVQVFKRPQDVLTVKLWIKLWTRIPQRAAEVQLRLCYVFHKLELKLQRCFAPG